MVMSFSAPPLEAPFDRITRFTKTDLTAAGQGGAWNVGSITLFTVTGLVRMRITALVTTAITSTGGTGTIAITNTAAATTIIAATTANGTTNFILNSVWEDNAPTLVTKAVTSAIDLAFETGTTTIIATIATNNITAGGLDIICEWKPLSAGATVV